MYPKKQHTSRPATSTCASEIINMSERYLGGPTTMWTLIAVVLVLVLSMDLVVEAKPNALTKKPPFNGSIFGKRSGPPPRPTPGYSGIGAISPPIDDYPAWPTLYEQVQQQQEAAWLNAAINRCLAQQTQPGLTVGTDLMNNCDELLALASVRDRFS